MSVLSDKKQKFIFKDQICDAKCYSKWMKCQKGILRFSGDNVTDFKLYRAWCDGCDKIRIVDRQDFEKQFRRFVKAVEETIEDECFE